MALTSEEIINADDAGIREIEVPEWKGVVCLRVISGKARDQFDQELIKATKPDGSVDIVNLRPLLLSFALCDGDGAPLFTLADVEKLNQKSANVLSRLFSVAKEMNDMTEEAVKKRLGNSEGDQSGVSG